MILEKEIKLDPIEKAIEEIKAGKVIIVVDDENRENEGDFVCAAECISPEIVNFMATHGRGLVCTPLVEERCDELGLELMVGKNTAAYETPFTVSVDLIGHGCTTGISASDRAKTIKALVDPNTNPEELGRPGHIFPLRARQGGVLRRPGHTECAIDFARLAGLKPAGVLVEIMNEDGSMARLPDLVKVAERFDLVIVSIKDLIEYRLQKESLINEVFDFDDNAFPGFRTKIFKQVNTGELHLALVYGEWSTEDEVPVRVHATNVISENGGFSYESGSSISRALEIIEKQGRGAVLLMNQQSPVEAEQKSAPDMDAKDYGVGAQILRALKLFNIRLITDSPKRRIGLEAFGISISETLAFSEK